MTPAQLLVALKAWQDFYQADYPRIAGHAMRLAADQEDAAAGRWNETCKRMYDAGQQGEAALNNTEAKEPNG